MPRIIKDEKTKPKGVITAHSFPNIHAVVKPGNGNGKRPASVFQRVNLGTASPAADGNAACDLDQQAAAIREAAYEEGFSQGQKSGMDQERKKIEPVINNFRQALSDLDKVKKNLYRNAEEQSLDLALAVARKIVCREVSINKELIIDIVREALERVSDQDRIKIRVSPCAVELLNDPTCAITDVLTNGTGICIEEDQTIGSGGCIIETEMGDIDARIEEQMQAVEKALRSELLKGD